MEGQSHLIGGFISQTDYCPANTQLLRDSFMIPASRTLVTLHNFLNDQIAIHVVLKLQGQTPQDLSPVRILDKSVGSSNYALS